MQKRKSRHGVHRVPRKDSEFDQYIRTTTDYLLGPAPGISLSRSLEMAKEGKSIEEEASKIASAEAGNDIDVSVPAQAMTDMIWKQVESGTTTLKDELAGLKISLKYIPARMTHYRKTIEQVILNLQKLQSP